MKKIFRKSYSWAIVYSVLMVAAFTYVMLDTFVIPKSQTVVDKASAESPTADTSENSAQDTDENTPDLSTQEESQADTKPTVTDHSYEDDNIKITIDTIREYDSTIYIADIKVSDAAYLKTAFANDTYGRNIKDITSNIAEENQAIFAINGDYYGFRDYGFVLRNGVLYRDNAGDAEALEIDKNGDFSIIQENETNLADMDTSSIWQILSFGPALITEGEIVVDNSSEVARSMTSNPRTAIGQISEFHYLVVVSDGRTEESEGLSLLELAQVFEDRGCTTAYNLDGGGSSTMYFFGEIINVPTDGHGIGERSVSDIVYIGY